MFQQAIHRHVFCAIHHSIEIFFYFDVEFITAKLFYHIGRRAAFIAVLRPQQPHQIVQIVLVVTALAQQNIQPQCNDAAFVVITDDVVNGTGVLFIKLVPGIKTRLGNALLKAPGIFVQPCEVLRDYFKVTLRRDNTYTGQGDIVIKAGEAFVNPQLVGVGFLTEVRHHHHIGFNTLNVPGVE